MPGFRDDRVNLGHVHFRRRFLVVRPQRAVKLSAMREYRGMEAAEFLDPFGGRRHRYGIAVRALFRVDAFDVVGSGGKGKARIDTDHTASLPRHARIARARLWKIDLSNVG
jgi:hypothetical protein